MWPSQNDRILGLNEKFKATEDVVSSILNHYQPVNAAIC